ncbi:MAG: sulfotransferase [Oscillospiraceae bacterium]|nr:sulfotransferase [Oscillospiraceae bacterium]MCL2160156.1 sulfotransferase [Oscillospiraceae bacterium]
MLITIIGRGHSGTRAMSHTLSQSGVFMGEPQNGSGDLLPPQKMYEACRVFAKYVTYEGGLSWDFSKVLQMDPDPEFVRLIEDYLASVLNSKNENRGWKIPETTLVYPWIIKMFPEIKYIHWTRDPRDCILGSHLTDDLHDFGIDYPKTDDTREKRAYSWKYQRELMKATPSPKNLLSLRFEDMVQCQDETLKKLEGYLGIKMAKIEMRSDSVGRWKTDTGCHMYDFFAEDMIECGYV